MVDLGTYYECASCGEGWIYKSWRRTCVGCGAILGHWESAPALLTEFENAELAEYDRLDEVFGEWNRQPLGPEAR
jgi:hypothetical protein